MNVMNHTPVRLQRILADLPLPLSLFILTTIIAGSFSMIGVDPHHDGIMFVPALNVARGAILFRDTFTQYGALTTFLQSWALNLFGHYLITIRLLTALCYGFIAVLLYGIGTKLMPRPLVVLTIIFWILTAPYYLVTFLPWASVYALLFQLAGTYALIRHSDSGHDSLLFWAGAATACTFLTRQPGGVFMAMAIYAYFFIAAVTGRTSLRLLPKKLFLFTSGVLIPLACFGIWLAIVGAQRDFWLQSIQFAYNFGTNRPHTILPALFPTGPDYLWLFFPIASIFVGILYLVELCKTQSRTAHMVLITTIVGLSAWLQYYPVPDNRHFYWGATGMYLIGTIAIYEIFRRLLFFIPKHRIHIAIGISGVILIGLCYPQVSVRIMGGLDKLRQSYVTVTKPEILRGMLLSKDEAAFYTSVADNMDAYFKENPRGNVVNLSRDALYMAVDPRIHSTNPLYINWAELYVIYPNFPYDMRAYVAQNHPLAIGTDAIIPEGNYCPMPGPPAINEIVLYKPASPSLDGPCK